MNLWDRLFGRPSTAPLHVWAGSSFRRTTWAERITSAERVGAHLRQRYGVTHGVPVGCVLENSPEAIDAVLGIWLAGGIVLSLPPRARGMARSEHVRQIRDLVAHAEAQLVVCSADGYEAFAAEVRTVCQPFGSLAGSGRCADPPAAGDTCFVQYSSGATAEPKGCAITPAAIGSQLGALGAALRLSPADRFASWLPLAHDMGFFGTFMLPWWHGLPACLTTPTRFAASPRSWLDDCADFRSTVTATPNFGLELAVRSLAGRGLGKRLLLRALVVGAEPVQWRSLRMFAAALVEAGFPFEGMTPAYGLAEATLAVTVAPPERPPRSVTVRREGLQAGKVEEASDEDSDGVPCVCVGAPIPGTAVHIDGDDVGEILVSSPSLASGYFNAPELSAGRFVDGMVNTGDIGFIRDGQLHVVGRSDDRLVVAGRSLAARELETCIAEAVGLPLSRIAVVQSASSESRIVGLVEYAPESRAAAHALAAAAGAAAVARSGVAIDKYLFLYPGAMPRSPSGELQRRRAEAIAAGDRATNIATVVAARNS